MLSLQSFVVGKKTFQYCNHFSLKSGRSEMGSCIGLPNLTYLQFGMNALQFPPNEKNTSLILRGKRRDGLASLDLPNLTSMSFSGDVKRNCTFRNPYTVALISFLLPLPSRLDFPKLQTVAGAPKLFSNSKNKTVHSCSHCSPSHVEIGVLKDYFKS